MKLVNKKIFYDFKILEILEAGIVLTGSEVKSVREGRIQLGGAYVKIISGEVWIVNAKIPEYENSRQKNYKVDRTRKLLLSKKQILRLQDRIRTKGLTLVPLSIYTKKGLVKLEIGIAKGRKQYEKKELKKQADIKREIERELAARE